MPPFTCCSIARQHGIGHLKTCINNPNYGKAFLSYPDGIGDVRFHRHDGKTVTLRRVEFDSISEKAVTEGDLSGEFENGNTFHVPYVAWWEVIYE